MAQVQHVRGVAQGGVDVVRDHDNRDVIAEVHELDEVIQFPRRHGVETRDRLIEQQELARGAQGAREQHALLLAAGERLIAVVRQILDAHALHVLLRAGAVGPRIEWAAVHLVDAARAHDLRHACGKVALELRLLRQIADLVAHEPVSERDAALLRRFVNTRDSFDMGVKVAYDFKLYKSVDLQLSAGVQNVFNAYQNDFDQGVERDSGYIYGPAAPRSYFAGIKISY